MDDLTHAEPYTESHDPAFPPPASLPEDEPVARGPWWTLQRKIGAAIVVALAIAALLPPWINVNRFRREVAAGISGSLGRPVHLDHVGLRLLPSPAFIIDNFVVGENSAFGAEPVVRSSSVIATLHISSLWRGRLEFASISLDEPSINLVRNPQGGWNVASILLQASQIATAPTAQKSAGSLPRFPYIEAENARVNIKLGNEKMPLSFTDAKFELWLSGPGRWQVRMEARPLRTDMDLSDTGTIKVEGELGRAASVAAVPLQLRAVWKDAQLGEVTRLLTGQDMGWRGQLEATAEARGTVGDALLTTRTGVIGLRREEFYPDRQLDLRMDCAARATGNFNAVNAINCNLPVGAGSLALSGGVADLRTAARPQLALQVRQVPAAEMLNLLRHASNVIAPELTAEGALDGKFTYGPQIGDTTPAIGTPPAKTHRTRARRGKSSALPTSTEASPGWTGEATLPSLTIRSPQWTRPLVLSSLRLVAGKLADDSAGADPRKKPAPATARQAAQPAAASGLYLHPVDLPLGAATASTLDGRFDRRGYLFHASGPATVARLLELDAALHFFGDDIQGLQPVGTADMDVRLQGPWERPLQQESALTPPAQQPVRLSNLTGSVQLKGARLRFRQTADEAAKPTENSARATTLPLGTIGLASAHLQFTPDAVLWDQIAGTYDGFRFEGEGTRPLACSATQRTGIPGQTNSAAVAAAGAPNSLAVASSSLATDDCAITFDLSATALDAVKIAAALSAAPERRSLLDLLPWNSSASPAWPAARGTLRVAAFNIGLWSMRNAVARIALQGDRASMESFDAKTLNGTIQATGSLSAAAPAWQYQVDASLQNAQLGATAALLRQSFASGTGDAHCALRMIGGAKSTLAQTAEGTCDWSLRKGVLNIAPKPAGSAAASTARQPVGLAPGSLVFDQWNGEATVGHGNLAIVSSTAKTQRGSIAVTGTVGLNRSADLTWGGQRIQGQLGRPDDGPGTSDKPGASSQSGALSQPGASHNGK